jgi:hypothetical protein
MTHQGGGWGVNPGVGVAAAPADNEVARVPFPFNAPGLKVPTGTFWIALAQAQVNARELGEQGEVEVTAKRRYTYASYKQFLREGRRVLHEQKLYAFQAGTVSVEPAKRRGNLYCTFTVFHAPSGEGMVVPFEWPIDSGSDYLQVGKAAGAAYSNAIRYFLRGLLLIGTNDGDSDDPERSGGGQDQGAQDAQTWQQHNQTWQQPAQQSWNGQSGQQGYDQGQQNGQGYDQGYAQGQQQHGQAWPAQRGYDQGQQPAQQYDQQPQQGGGYGNAGPSHYGQPQGQQAPQQYSQWGDQQHTQQYQQGARQPQAAQAGATATVERPRQQIQQQAAPAPQQQAAPQQAQQAPQQQTQLPNPYSGQPVQAQAAPQQAQQPAKPAPAANPFSKVARPDEPNTSESWITELRSLGWPEGDAEELAVCPPENPITPAVREALHRAIERFYGTDRLQEARDAWKEVGFVPNPDAPEAQRPKPTGIQALRYARRMKFR